MRKVIRIVLALIAGVIHLLMITILGTILFYSWVIVSGIGELAWSTCHAIANWDKGYLKSWWIAFKRTWKEYETTNYFHF